jgi:ergothioneine biosynthesis protein EgtB
MLQTVEHSVSARDVLLARYQAVRVASARMCASLEPAEYRLQPIDDVSPPWWNLGHTSWFFARNVLASLGGAITADDAQYDYLLNSYYASLGARLPRSQRGAVSRPTTEEIYAYRASVDERVQQLVETIDSFHWPALEYLLRIGIEHEQQHQELFYTEIKFILAQNPPPLRRSYCDSPSTHREEEQARPLQFCSVPGGLVEIGSVEDDWCWDNELPAHKYYLVPYELADRLVTNQEYLEFIDDGGYRNQLLWLDNGWQQRTAHAWQAPLYWERNDGVWQIWTLAGYQPLRPHEPVSHLSFYEADAFARWRSETRQEESRVRLPSEREWEHAARRFGETNAATAFLDAGLLHPQSQTPVANAVQALREMSGVLWQWTSSYYEPYPGYRPFPGVLAEYNGKFMDNQRVLRGGSCVTPRNHYRLSYRNFWSAATRFQFTGVRLARDSA